MTLVFLTIIHQTFQKNVKISDLRNNPGILPFKLGPAKVKIATHTFLHFVDIKPIENQITNLTLQYETIKDHLKNQKLNENYEFSLENLQKHIEYQITSLKEKFQSIFPFSNRKKRGLINGLGSVIKAISGNLDQEDAKRYDHAIDTLKNNQNEIVKSFNQEISLSNELLKNTNRTFSLIIQNQKIIQKNIENLKNNNSYFFETMYTLTEIKYNLDTLSSFLSEIETSISFAKLGTLHHSIISNNEMKSLCQTLLKHHSINQVVFPNIKDISNQYEIISVEAYLSNDRLVFALHVPLVHPDNFVHYHLYSIPTSNSTTIIPKNTFLTMSNDWFQYDANPCRYIHTIYLCENNHLISGSMGDCIFSMLQINGEISICEMVSVIINKPLIEEVTDSHYIAIFPKAEKIQTKCDQTDFVMLQGTYLLEVPYRCSISTLNLTYANEKGETIQKPLYLPEIKIKQAIEVQKLKLEDIPLDQLHEIQSKTNAIEPLQFNQFKNSHHPWTIPIYIMVILALSLYSLKRCKKAKTTSNIEEGKQENQTPATSKVLFFQPKTST